MNKQQLAAKIWASANQMRSKIEANEYKDYILGFIFYKFLSDQELKFLYSEGYTDEDIDTVTEDDAETVDYLQKNIGYFISYDNLFSTWLGKGSDFNVGNVRDALNAFSRNISPTHKNVFDGIFNTLETGLSKLGDSAASQTKAISDLLYLIKDIPMDGKQDYDVLGFIYEYLISNFAANAGKKAGEFYTPFEVSTLMSEIVADHLKDRSAIKIFDPTSGSGSLLINIGQAAAKHIGDRNKIKYYAQELKQNTYNLTRMNLVMRGILPDNIVTRCADTLEEDWPYFDEADPVGTYEPLYVDAVVSNPPYSQSWNPTDKESDPRYARFGLAPKGKADYAFLLHDLFHLKPDGVMTIVLPHGVLFRGGEEGAIRENLIEHNHIDAIIGLPANIFFGTGIPTIIMVLRQKRENTDVLIIDASKGFEKVGKNNRLRACDIKKITDTVAARKGVPRYAKVVSRADIRQNDYNLNIPRYVDASEKPESWDIYASMFGGIPQKEIDELADYWQAFPHLREDLLTSEDGRYFTLTAPNIAEAVKQADDVRAFSRQYQRAFDGFDAYLSASLLDHWETVNLSRAETVLSADVFERLAPVPLVDRYAAYQLLHEQWANIAVDLEILQTEGFAAAKQVDANMVVKKKNGKDVETQDGWVGHVLPFDLVQKAYFADACSALRRDEDRLSEIAAGYEELLDTLPEEEKDKDFVKEDGSAFVWKEVNKALKAKEADDAVLLVLKQAKAYNDEEKKLKKQIKAETEQLHLDTKAKIEALTDDAVMTLLREKWVAPLCRELMTLPDGVIGELVGKLERLAEKYEVTFADVEKEIAETEASLSAMLSDLRGNEFDMRGIAELKNMLGGA